MTEQSKEKLLEKLNKAFEYLPLSIANGQARRQIKEIIKLHFSDDWQQVKKDLGKFMKEQKPEVTNEWIQGKTVELIEIISKGNILVAMSFIRSLVEELNAKANST